MNTSSGPLAPLLWLRYFGRGDSLLYWAAGIRVSEGELSLRLDEVWQAVIFSDAQAHRARLLEIASHVTSLRSVVSVVMSPHRSPELTAHERPGIDANAILTEVDNLLQVSTNASREAIVRRLLSILRETGQGIDLLLLDGVKLAQPLVFALQRLLKAGVMHVICIGDQMPSFGLDDDLLDEAVELFQVERRMPTDLTLCAPRLTDPSARDLFLERTGGHPDLMDLVLQRAEHERGEEPVRIQDIGYATEELLRSPPRSVEKSRARLVELLKIHPELLDRVKAYVDGLRTSATDRSSTRQAILPALASGWLSLTEDRQAIAIRSWLHQGWLLNDLRRLRRR